MSIEANLTIAVVALVISQMASLLMIYSLRRRMAAAERRERIG